MVGTDLLCSGEVNCVRAYFYLLCSAYKIYLQYYAQVQELCFVFYVQISTNKSLFIADNLEGLFY